DADIADDVGHAHAGVRIAGGAEAAEGEDARAAGTKVVHRGAVPNDGIVETDARRHAVAELHRVLNLVHTGVGVLAAEQARGDVAREALPRSGVGRSRFAEGEAGELDKHVLDRDVTFTRLIQQAGGGAGRRRAGEHQRVD